jgi:predicted ester cyclase
MADAKEIVKRLIEEPWTGSFDVIDELVSRDFVGYDAAEPEPIRGPAGLKANFEKYLAGFSNARCTVDDQVAEGNKVATRWTGKGTHDGEIAGIAPTGKEVTITGLTISKVENGMLVEDRTVWDTLGMLMQIGAVPMPTTA